MLIIPIPVYLPNQLANSRLTREIERTLWGGTNTPHTEYDKEKVEGHKLETQRILSTLTTPGLVLDGSLSADTRVPYLTPVDHHGTATTSLSESGVSPTVPSSIMLIAPRLFLLS